MSTNEVDGPNSGYASLLLEDYLEDPGSVSPEWRALFESGESSIVAALPGLQRLLAAVDANGRSAPAETPAAVEHPAAVETVAPAEAVDETLLGGVAAAMALVKAHRMHGHLAARLDPLGSEPTGDPALDEQRLIPPLTPELQARISSSLLRVHVPGLTLLEALPALKDVYCGHEVFTQRIRNYSDKPIEVEVERPFAGHVLFRSELKPTLFDFRTPVFTTTVQPAEKKDHVFEIVRQQGRNVKQNNVTLEAAAVKP